MNRRLPLSHIYWALGNAIWSTKTYYLDYFYYLHAVKVFKYLMMFPKGNPHQDGYLGNYAQPITETSYMDSSTVSDKQKQFDKGGILNLKQGRNTYKFDTNKCCSRMCSKILLGREIFTAQKSTQVARECLIFHCTLSAHHVEASSWPARIFNKII